VVGQYRPTMFQQVKESGWPEDMQNALNNRRSATNADERHRTCLVCGEVFGHLWLRRRVCCLCEQTRRGGGTCPFGLGCGGANGSLFCPHAHRCFLCDAHSCEQCRLVHGDGEDVTMLVQTLQVCGETLPVRARTLLLLERQLERQPARRFASPG